MQKILKMMSIFLIGVLFLSGCSTETSKEKTDSKTGTQEVNFMIPEWGVPTDEMIKEFEDESGIKVNIMTTSWDDIRNKVSTAAAGKKAAADVFEVDWSWVGEFQKAGWLEPQEISSEDEEDMKTVKTFSINGKLYAMPYSNDYRIAYYNKEMFDKAGIKDVPKTWDEVIEDAKILKDKKVVEYPISNPMAATEKSTTTFLWLTYTRNGKVFNDDNTLNKEATLDALKVLDKINREGLSDPANRNSEDAFPKISSGETAFMVGPSSYVVTVNNHEKSKVVNQVVPVLIPGKDANSTSTVPFAEAVGISPYSENKEAAKKFVQWYTSKETQYKLYEKVSVIPTRTSVIQKLLDDKKIQNAGAMLELSKMIENPFPNGVPTYYTKMSTEIFNAINQMANEKISAEEAADQMVEKVNKIVNENK